MTAENMSTTPAPATAHELGHLRSHWWFLLIMGILLLVGGTIAIVYPLVASVAFIRVLAVILLIAGVATLITSFWAGQWSGFLVHLLVGILYIAAGLIVSEQQPLVTLTLLTLFVAIAFMVIGLFRALAAMVVRFPQWGWALLSGGITFLAGLVIYRNMPISALWVIGLLVGLEMLFNGWTYIMLALLVRRVARVMKA
jgi:uncharacterized membrane protein HdeD (DUF308 family)